MSRKRMARLASLLWDDTSEAKDLDQLDVGSRTSQEQQQASRLELERENSRLKRLCGAQESELQSLRTQVGLWGNSYKLPELVSDYAAWCPKSTKDRWHFLNCTPDALLDLPRWKTDIVPQLEATKFGDGQLVFNLVDQSKQHALASKILEHAEVVSRSLSFHGPCVYKIGICADPVSRWGFYKRASEKFQGMVILHMAESSFEVGMIESHLIRLFRSTPGCRNTAPGGETLSSQPGPHFVYVVYKTLGPRRA